MSEHDWSSSPMLSKCLSWTDISDSEVAVVKQWLGAKLQIPTPLFVRAYRGRMCRCPGPHGKTAFVEILDSNKEILQTVEVSAGDVLSPA